MKASELTHATARSLELLHRDPSRSALDGWGAGRPPAAEEGAVSGQMNATIREAYTLPMGDGTMPLSRTSSTASTISANQIEHFTMQLSAAYHRQGELVDGTLSDMTHILSTGELSGEGELTLMRDLSQSTDNGAWTFLVAQATLSASIASNQLERLGGTIPWRVYDGDGS